MGKMPIALQKRRQYETGTAVSVRYGRRESNFIFYVLEYVPCLIQREEVGRSIWGRHRWWKAVHYSIRFRWIPQKEQYTSTSSLCFSPLTFLADQPVLQPLLTTLHRGTQKNGSEVSTSVVSENRQVDDHYCDVEFGVTAFLINERPEPVAVYSSTGL
jgi:hypothetical protein